QEEPDPQTSWSLDSCPCPRPFFYGKSESCRSRGPRNEPIESLGVLPIKPALRQAKENSDEICLASTPSPFIRETKRESYSLPPRVERIRWSTFSLRSGK